MPLSDNSLEAIVAALLAVNRFGLEKAYSLLPALREAGLTRPGKVVNEDLGAVTVRLAQAGYDRGLLTGMMAGRLVTLMQAVDRGELDSFEGLLARGDLEKATSLLCQVYGIGPKVAADAWLLLRG